MKSVTFFLQCDTPTQRLETERVTGSFGRTSLGNPWRHPTTVGKGPPWGSVFFLTSLCNGFRVEIRPGSNLIPQNESVVYTSSSSSLSSFTFPRFGCIGNLYSFPVLVFLKTFVFFSTQVPYLFWPLYVTDSPSQTKFSGPTYDCLFQDLFKIRSVWQTTLRVRVFDHP